MSCWVSDLLDVSKFTANPKSFSSFMHSMLGFRLAWWRFNKCVSKFSECHVWSPTCLALQSLPQTWNLFLHFVHSMLRLRLAVSNLLNFTKKILPFLHKQIITKFFYFFHKICTLFEIASGSNILSDSLRCFLKIQYRFKVQHLNDSLSHN